MSKVVDEINQDEKIVDEINGKLMNLSEAIVMSNARDEQIEEIETVRNRVKDMNDQILNLIYTRELMIEDMERKISNISGAEYFLGVSSNLLEDAVKNNGITCDVATRAILTVRQLLFDDSDENFRRFSCCNINFNSYSGDYVSLIGFEFTDGKTMFEVNIPQKINVISSNHKKWYGMDVFDEYDSVGQVTISMWVSSHCHDYMFGSLVLSEVTNYLRKLVTNVDEVITAHNERFKECFFSGSEFSPRKFRPSLSKLLIESGFDYRRR